MVNGVLCLAIHIKKATTRAHDIKTIDLNKYNVAEGQTKFAEAQLARKPPNGESPQHPSKGTLAHFESVFPGDVSLAARRARQRLATPQARGALKGR
jgi:hypothetical protein